jgi:hypothetical protein
VYDGQPGVESYARTPQVKYRYATAELIPDQIVFRSIFSFLFLFGICDDVFLASMGDAESAMLLILSTPLPCRSICSPPNPSTGRLCEPLSYLSYRISTSFVPSCILTVSHSLFRSLHQHQHRHYHYFLCAIDRLHRPCLLSFIVKFRFSTFCPLSLLHRKIDFALY